MKPEEIYLNKEQREELTAFVKKGKHDVRLVNRAKVIFLRWIGLTRRITFESAGSVKALA
ncbi:hypothetical protein AGMMS49992_21960 [Clostridia bacterium]|nr:hypothetical protein AGMMS49992_21960 [Clostridia bacterium]